MPEPPAKPDKVPHPADLTAEVRANITHLAHDEGWPASEIQETLGVRSGAIRRWTDKEVRMQNHRDWLAVVRWARNAHPDLFNDIRPVLAREAGRRGSQAA